MKADAPPPLRPPRKRRPLEQAPDLWLATWLARDDLTPSERRRVTEEKERRKERKVSIIVGFTGAREGLTPPQREFVRTWLTEREPTEAHHGDCVGGDEQFHGLCVDLGVPVVLHPPEDGKLRAYCQGAGRTEKAKPYLERNKEIVRAASVMIGCPKEGREPAPGRGQGTWSTIRYARKRGGEVKVVMTNGELQESEVAA